MSSEIITSNDLKKILASAFPARANTTITSITLPYTPPCNGLFIGMLRASAQGRAYKQYSNTEPSLWDFYQVAGGYSTFASFVQAGKQIAETATANISDAPYYFFVPLDGTSPLFGGSADAVIEQGTSGDWFYRKWYSGRIEADLVTTNSIAMTTAIGNEYFGNITVNISNLGLLTIRNIQVTGNCPSFYSSSKVEGVSLSSFAISTRSNSSMTGTVTHYIHIEGTWK